MNARNLLYIAFNFPPLAGPSPRHNLGTIKGLLAHGFAPTVLTAPEGFRYMQRGARVWPQDEYLRSRIPDTVRVLRCPWPFPYQRFLNALSGTLRFTPLSYFFTRGRDQIYAVARRELDTHPYELIYSVNGIGLEHAAALELKRHTGLPWVAEFRDPWIHNPWEWQAIRDKSWGWWCARQYRRLKAHLEAIVHAADLVVVESPLHAEYLVHDFDLDPHKVAALGMGYDPSYLSERADSSTTFPARPVIGFVGRVYYGYEYAIGRLVDALAELERAGHVFSVVSVGADTHFEDYAKGARLRHFLSMGRVDYARALSIMSQLDFGVVATCDTCRPHINSKLWEYLALGLSILALAPPDGSMASLIAEGHCGYVLPYETAGMLPVLATALNDYDEQHPRRASPAFIERYSRTPFLATLAQRIDELL